MNDEFSEADVVNPAARHATASPIYGMPILDVDKAHTVMVIKRSMNPGFAGIENFNRSESLPRTGAREGIYRCRKRKVEPRSAASPLPD